MFGAKKMRKKNKKDARHFIRPICIRKWHINIRFAISKSQEKKSKFSIKEGHSQSMKIVYVNLIVHK